MRGALRPGMNNIDLTILATVTGGLNTTFTPSPAQIKSEVAADKKFGYQTPKAPIVKHWFDAPAPSFRF